MSLFKKKITYQDLMRLSVMGLYPVTPVDVSSADVDNVLTDAEKKKISYEIHFLELMTTFFNIVLKQWFGRIKSLLPNGNNQKEMNEILGRDYILAIGQAMSDKAIKKEEALREINELIPIFEGYLKVLESMGDATIKEGEDKAIHSALVTHFTERIVDKVDLKNNEKRYKYFLIYDIGRQSNENFRNAFGDFTKKIIIL